MALVVKPPLWTLEQGVGLVRFLQPLTRRVSYHLAIGGGVINNGSSTKDVDLYFLPLDNLENQPEPDQMKGILDAIYGMGVPIVDTDKYGDAISASVYKHKLKYTIDGKRADVFIF